MRRIVRRMRAGLVLMASGGVAFQFSGCGIASVISNINPCNAIFACDPAQYDFATSGIDEPGVNLNQDPFCTWAPYCDAGVDPIFGGLGEP